jgi:hypothetical protein
MSLRDVAEPRACEPKSTTRALGASTAKRRPCPLIAELLDLVSMSARPITEELVQQVSEDLRTRYALDEEDVRALGARLADQDRVDRHDENIAFAERFTTEHRETFDRLGQ